MHRLSAAIALALSGCQLAGAWAEEQVDAAPAVLFVRQGAAPQLEHADGSEARPFPSIGAALAAAPAGALLRIDEGIYRENLVLTRRVVLLGRGAGRTRIVAADARTPSLEVRPAAEHVEIHGLSIEEAATCASFTGGKHKLRNFELRNCIEAALVGRGAQLELVAGSITAISGGRDGRGVDLQGGSLTARAVVFREAGRRAIVLNGAGGVLEDLEVHGSSLSALQATGGADAQVLRGIYEGRNGAALYAGGSRLRVEGARVRRGEYAILGFKGAEVIVVGGELTDYSVAGVALVNAHGSVEKVTISRGGTDAAISITRADGMKPVLLADNRISHPGTMGVHVTESAVTVRGNTITGARLDAESDMGDAVFAVDSRLVIEQNVMRANAGSGVAALRSQVRLTGNGFFGNGRAGLLLLDSSRGSATGNTFTHNQRAGVELGELARATLTQNRFGRNVRLDVDAGCGKGLSGTADIGEGNFALGGVLRQRICPP